MLAPALWDDPWQCLILEKSLLYAESDRRVIFASEVQARLLDPLVPREMDPAALDAYLTYLAIPAPPPICRAARKISAPTSCPWGTCPAGA